MHTYVLNAATAAASSWWEEGESRPGMNSNFDRAHSQTDRNAANSRKQTISTKAMTVTGTGEGLMKAGLSHRLDPGSF